MEMESRNNAASAVSDTVVGNAKVDKIIKIRRAEVFDDSGDTSKNAASSSSGVVAETANVDKTVRNRKDAVSQHGRARRQISKLSTSDLVTELFWRLG